MTLDQLIATETSGETKIRAQVTAQIAALSPRKLTYKACINPTCKHALQQVSQQKYFCSKCKSSSRVYNLAYRVSALITNGDQEAWISLFDPAASSILGIPPKDFEILNHTERQHIISNKIDEQEEMIFSINKNERGLSSSKVEAKPFAPNDEENM
ncbi:hypothetical protein Bbelb_373110 [Branchiostoma belcheri]|nr:hypothetical protein Bbelb_373110 [Branchiostoma belcheri]